MENPVTVKRCLRCGEEKPLTEFYRYIDKRPKRTMRRYTPEYRTTADGHRAQCKTCCRQLPCRSAAYRQSEKRLAAAKKGKRYRTIEEITSLRTAKRQHLQLTQRPREMRKLYRLLRSLLRQKCAESGQTYSSVVYAARYRNDEQFREREIVRTWMRKAASGVLRTDHRSTRLVHDDGTLDSTVRQALFAAARHCPYCQREMDGRSKSLDHIIPTTRGGPDSITNVLVCCKNCNSRKGTRTPAEMGWPIAEDLVPTYLLDAISFHNRLTLAKLGVA